MMTLKQHIADNRALIEKQAREYAQNFGCTMDEARRDTIDAFAQGWHDEADEAHRD